MPDAAGPSQHAQDTLRIGQHAVHPGQTRDVSLPVTQTATGQTVVVPIRVVRAAQPGPTVFVTGAVHGDEINGTGIVRELILAPGFELERGSLILVPVVNVIGFEDLSRYLPDRRDLNREFPGSLSGSASSRFAATIFRDIVRQANYGIDLHSAAVRRTNFPNVRVDPKNEEAMRLARAFGCELVVTGKGPAGSLRNEACRAGVPTIILEAGEVWKVEPAVLEVGLRGVKNCLAELGMIAAPSRRPAYQAVVEKTRWIRAKQGGLLRFHIGPGQIVRAGQPLATTADLLGGGQAELASPSDGVVLGMTTMPAVVPGDPICHIAIPQQGIDDIERRVAKLDEAHLHERLRDQLATNVAVQDAAG